MDKTRIVNFHGIGNPRRELEPGEERYWISRDRFRAMLDRIASHPEAGRIRITFDDGNASDAEIALPELQARGLGASFFVLARRLGQRGSLSGADIQALVREGMEVGSHGIDHVDWSSLPRDELKRQVADSRSMIGEVTGQPVDAAAIPFGRYNAAVLGELRSAGYRRAYSSDGGGASGREFPQPRTSVVSDMPDQRFEEILAGRATVPARLRRWAGRAIKSRI